MNGCGPPMMMAGPVQMGDMGMQTPLHIMTSMGPPAKVMVTLVSFLHHDQVLCGQRTTGTSL